MLNVKIYQNNMHNNAMNSTNITTKQMHEIVQPAKRPEPVYIIDDDEDDDDDEDHGKETESQSEQFDSDYFEKPAYVHRKSVSFDLSGDERGKSDYECPRTPDSSSQHYDSEQEFTSRKYPKKGILRSTSPCSSNNSTIDRSTKTTDTQLPIVPTVARIREIESPVYHRSPSPASSRPRSPPPPNVVEEVPTNEEIEHDNPFRESFLQKNHTDDYTEMAKVISKSPTMLKSSGQKFQYKSNEELLSSTSENRPKVKPPPPPKPKVLKKADIVRNLALDTFQSTDMGQGDITVYEHDADANIIHEIASSGHATPTTTGGGRSPKLPVRILTRSISRPRESPPLPPVNYATMPKSPEIPAKVEAVEYLEILPPLGIEKKSVDGHHENSKDNILVTQDEHRELMLRENELRNQLKKCIETDDLGVPDMPAPAVPARGSSKHLVNEFSSSNDTLDSWPIVHRNYNHNNTSLSTNNINSIITNMQPNLDTAAAPLLATQLFPSAQILPVQYAHLPQPQQSYANMPKFSFGSYVLIPQTQLPMQSSHSASAAALTSAPIFINSQNTQQLFQLPLQQQQQQQQQIQLVSDKSQKITSPTPSYTAMQFRSLSEINTPSAFKFPPLPATPIAAGEDDDNYQNTSKYALDCSNSSINTASTFSKNSSQISLPKTTSTNQASYYETAEEIYSIIQEDAIYSNTAFFDSRRSSDTSLNRLSLTSINLPPPLPPKNPKHISQSQPELVILTKKQKPLLTGKETTV